MQRLTTLSWYATAGERTVVVMKAIQLTRLGYARGPARPCEARRAMGVVVLDAEARS
jgi:hypothetical protein